MKQTKGESKDGNLMLTLSKGALAAAVLSVVLIALYALALQQEWLDPKSMPIASSAIKVIGAAAAALIAIRGRKQRKWLVGGGAGLLYTLLAFMVFSILANTFQFSTALLFDMGMGALTGTLSAMIAQLLK